MRGHDGNRDAAPVGWRGWVIVAGFALVAAALVARAVDLQLLEHEALSERADRMHLDVERLAAHRGPILDRHGEPLAVSTPVDAVYANPQEFEPDVGQLRELAEAIGRDPEWVARRVTSAGSRRFVYLRRHLPPEQARRAKAVGVPGVDTLREYQRYYPAAEVAGHVVGFTDIDDHGQEGLELAYDEWLRGTPGAKRVLRDRRRQSVEDVESIRPTQPGKTLSTSLDLRLQYLAYRELKRAVRRHGARSGSVVMIDVATGEVLAMANQPGYNPNDRSQLTVANYRNRAATDILEPGSSIKPLIVAAALDAGFDADAMVQTSPGYLEVDGWTIRDPRDFGSLNVTSVLTRSSNVGITRIALALDAQALWSALSGLGLGRLTASGFPGESAGLFNDFQHWRPINQATIAYGYGLSVTPLQLAQAYATLGAGGTRRPVTFLRAEAPPPGEPVISPRTARRVIAMMETVVGPEGTGSRAAVPGYRVAGKTGTTHKSEAGGYADDLYRSVFAGLAPASAPRLATVVVLDEPQGEEHFGGDVAAPVFSAVVSGALRLLAVAPDDLPREAPRSLQASAAVDSR